jgi:tetraacyldisaccharide 4'-kinase
VSVASVIVRLWYREPLPRFQRVLLAPLWVASWIFGAVSVLRTLAYRGGLLRRTRVPARVISVGNLVAGGAGKTPVVIYLAQRMIERGVRAAVLSRGYGGNAGKGPCLVSRGSGPLVAAAVGGDEPVLIARRCRGVGVVVAKRRDDAARFALSELSPQVLLLDDGFQHHRLARDLEIVVVDAEKVFGNGHMLPYGPLREPRWALSRADVLWFSRCDDASPIALDVAEKARRNGKRVVRSTYRVSEVVELQSGGLMGSTALKGAKVLMLAGVARPDSFRNQLVRAGASVVGESVFPDHHRFSPEEVDQVEALRRKLEAAVVVTTEKDAARLEAPPPGWLAVQLGVHVVEGEAELAGALFP